MEMETWKHASGLCVNPAIRGCQLLPGEDLGAAVSPPYLSIVNFLDAIDAKSGFHRVDSTAG